MKLFMGLGVLGLIALCVGILGLTVYGLYLAFSASILLGIIVLLVEPSPLLIGLVMVLYNKNLAEMFINWLNN